MHTGQSSAAASAMTGKKGPGTTEPPEAKDVVHQLETDQDPKPITRPPKTSMPKPPEPVTTHYFTNIEDPSFVYPEASDTKFGIPSLKSKPSFGIAVSGGGFRATTVAYGWVRGLKEIGVLEQAQYISSNSGGSWFNGAFSYRDEAVDDAKFFEPYMRPQDLTLEYISSDPQPDTYADRIANGNAVQDILKAKLVENLRPLKKWLATTFGWGSFKDAAIEVEPWSTSIAKTFLEPFGCGGLNSTVSCAGTQGHVAYSVRDRMNGLPVYMASEDRPFPIICGSLYCPPGDGFKFYPVEFTPLYTGLPASDHDTKPIKLGAFFLEPLAFNSQPPQQGTALESSKDGSKEVSVYVEHTVPLALAVGISSSFLAVGVTMAKSLLNPELQDLGSTELLSVWSPADDDPSILPFADGGAQDNLAIFPLLRRKVKKIVQFVATSKPFTRAFTTSMVANDSSDIAGLFGAVPEVVQDYEGNKTPVTGVNGVQVALFNKQSQVFAKEKWQELYEKMANAVDNGRPAVFKQTYDVMANKFQNVHPYQVEVLWVFNQRCDEWEAQLPGEVQQKLQKERPKYFKRRDLLGEIANAAIDSLVTKTLENHPLYTTYTLNMANEPVKMLSNQATWTVVDAPGVAELIKEMAGL